MLSLAGEYTGEYGARLLGKTTIINHCRQTRMLEETLEWDILLPVGDLERYPRVEEGGTWLKALKEVVHIIAFLSEEKTLQLNDWFMHCLVMLTWTGSFPRSHPLWPGPPFPAHHETLQAGELATPVINHVIPVQTSYSRGWGEGASPIYVTHRARLWPCSSYLLRHLQAGLLTTEQMHHSPLHAHTRSHKMSLS